MSITLLLVTFSAVLAHSLAIEFIPGVGLPCSGVKVSDWSFIEENQLGLVITEASAGDSIIYQPFQSNWEIIKKFGILAGTYHYYISSAGPHANFENAEKNLFSKVNFTGDELVAVNFQDNSGKKSQADLAEDLHTFLWLVEEKYHIRPIIRTDVQFWDSQIGSAGDDYQFGEYRLWAVDYTPNQLRPTFSHTWKDYLIWEYSHVDHLKGVEYNLVYFLLLKVQS